MMVQTGPGTQIGALAGTADPAVGPPRGAFLTLRTTGRRRKGRHHYVAFAQACRGLRHPAVHRDGLLANQMLQRCAAEERDSIDQVLVQPLIEVTR